MAMSAWKRAGVCLTAAVAVVGVAGCQDGDGGEKGKEKAAAPAESEPQAQNQMTEVLRAAFKKTSEAKSSKVRMTMTMPAAAGGGTMEISGVQGWDPAVMDVTMKGPASTAGAPEQTRMVMLDNVLYTNMGAKQAAQMDGKHWMKMDFTAFADGSGDAALQKQMANGMESLNQDPAQQLALLLESPNLKHVGPEKVDGVQTQHYKGTLSFEEMLDANKSADSMLSEKERKDLVASVEKAGMKGYDTQVWVNEDNYPVKMVVGMKMAQGTMDMTAHYSDYGTEIDVQAPPAGDTVDFVEMLKELESLEAESGAGLGS
jgi:hypothetical protein